MELDLNEKIQFYKKRKSWLIFLANYFLVACIIVSLFIVTFFVFYAEMEVHGISMRPTLNSSGNDIVFVNKFNKGQKGNIVVIDKYDSETAHKYIIKRLIATGGDSVYYLKDESDTWHLYVNNVKLSEPYLQNLPFYNSAMQTSYENFESLFTNPESEVRDLFSFTKISESLTVLTLNIPLNCVFVLGDNRGHSNDSSMFGPCKTSDVIGVAEHIIPYGKSVFLYFLKEFSTINFYD